MTEERFDGSAGAESRESPWWGVHVSRYLYAASHVRGRRVLDVACGTGYGLSVLGAEARTVVGADADLGSARTARHGTTGAPHAVLVSDGAQLPFGDGTFEVVTSFETLEHLCDRDSFLDEIRRVLAPGGVLILSTPNALYTEPVNGVPRNRFHVHEYTPDELASALTARFARVELRGQVLSPRFVVSPFWDDQQKMPKALGRQSALLLWRMLNRLPAALRDAVSRAVWGHRLIPDEHDYEFPAEVGLAPVVVAICHVCAGPKAARA